MVSDGSNRDDVFRERLARARDGDREALNALLRGLEPRVTQLVSGRVGARLRRSLRTSDVIQNTWLEVIDDLSGFSGETEASFIAWVAKVMENGVRTQSRRMTAKKRGSRKDVQSLDIIPGGVTGDAATPSREVASGEDLDLIRRAIDQLPSDYRRVVQLVLVEEHSHKSASEILGRSEGATRMLLARARTELGLIIDRMDRHEG